MVVAIPVMLPRKMGRPRPVTMPSSDSASARPMLTPAPSEAANPTKKPVFRLSCKAGDSENRCKGRDRAIHQTQQCRLDFLQNEILLIGTLSLHCEPTLLPRQITRRQTSRSRECGGLLLESLSVLVSAIVVPYAAPEISAWRRAPAVEEACGRRERTAEAAQSLA
jgi:hypothetical protein